jgi:ABC-type antimicrobial peptide transport system permease subunit
LTNIEKSEKAEFFRQGIGLAAIGIIAGILGAVVLRKVVAGRLYGISALDFRVFLLASLVLFGVAILACFVPAQRAARIQPAELLRIE